MAIGDPKAGFIERIHIVVVDGRLIDVPIVVRKPLSLGIAPLQGPAPGR